MRTSIEGGFTYGLLMLLGCPMLACGGGDPPVAAVPTGALITTSLHSRVGYLLDELPQSLRDRAAESLIAQPEATWIEHARAQVNLTTYRLVFRDAFYDESEGKGQLPLPPKEKWQITLDSAPARSVVRGHDLVLVDYTLTSALLTDAASPALSDPALADIGASVEEPFVLPLDPELLLQRTGYSCMDESEFPPNSVDGENVYSFYDQDCEGGDSDCHITETPDESCQEALDRTIGSISTSVHFERSPWDQDLAENYRVGEPGPDGADLQVIGEGLDNHRVIYRYISATSCAAQENCVTGLGWRRLLQFDASLKNVGSQALDIGDVSLYLDEKDTLLANHNIFVYSPCHQHYHFSHYGDFVFSTDQDTHGNKQAFCLQSTSRYGNNETSPLTHPYSDCSYQGIQAGWGDDYGAGIECQWIDVTDAATSNADTQAKLTFKANPDKFLCEGSPVLDANGIPEFEDSGFTTATGARVDRPECTFLPDWDKNNEDSRAIMLPPEGGFVVDACSRGQIGPVRDCGFSAGVAGVQSVDCPVGGTIELSCSVPEGASPAVVRVCEYSEKLGSGVSCVYRDALANSMVDSDPVTLNITCPDAHDVTEVGGHVSLYSAPALPGDEVQVTCTVVQQ